MSLSDKKPDLITEWDFNKNTDFDPTLIACSSTLKVNWMCNQGHQWIASIHKRVFRNDGCPVCFSLLPAKKNPLTAYKDVCLEWNYEKNISLVPETFSSKSHKKVWWKCSLGHEWIASIQSRTNGNGCPFCSNKRVSETNSLAIKYPEIASRWHPSKNGLLTPFDFTFGSGKNVWWICSFGHEWMAPIYSRHNRGCPTCAGVRNKADIYIDGKKICNACNEPLDFSYFPIKYHKNGKVYYAPSCKKCTNDYINRLVLTDIGIAKDIVYRKKSYAKKYNIPFDLTVDWVLNRLNEIEWKCELTKIPMTLHRGRIDNNLFAWNSISVDRIDPNKGYVKSNVRFILNQINSFRTDGGDDRMYLLARALLDNRKI